MSGNFLFFSKSNQDNENNCSYLKDGWLVFLILSQADQLDDLIYVLVSVRLKLLIIIIHVKVLVWLIKNQTHENGHF